MMGDHVGDIGSAEGVQIREGSRDQSTITARTVRHGE
jgi:hypothetical protein